MLSFFKTWRRKRALRRARLDPALWRQVSDALPFLRGLTPAEWQRLQDFAVLFLDEKEMHGARGFVPTDAVRLSIAVQACLPVLNLGLDAYDGWVGIVIYPGEFKVRRAETDASGVVHEFDDELSGEAWPGGPVILSWQDVELSAAGYNVVIHEFAHKLHMSRGNMDDFPAPHSGMNRELWLTTWDTAYDEFCAQVDRGMDTVIDPYASEQPAEFFAVLSEAFFTLPQAVRSIYPELYTQLAQFYRQDPAARL
ncbi:MAG: zinc-dependent peptidase [Betaproteobacteria bacterium]|nr:MAG: zinc-dependent peptidase [Betaproteobacteria bacterium]